MGVVRYWLFWVILIVAVIGVILWYVKSRKKGVTPSVEKKEEGPGVPPSGTSQGPQV